IAASDAAARDDTEITALDLPPTAPLTPAMAAYFEKCRQKLGFVPNVLKAYGFDMAKLEAFVAMYNDLMLAPSGLSKLEREMIAVAVSSHNRCYYCLVAHGAAVRQLSGGPRLLLHDVPGRIRDRDASHQRLSRPGPHECRAAVSFWDRTSHKLLLPLVGEGWGGGCVKFHSLEPPSRFARETREATSP